MGVSCWLCGRGRVGALVHRHVMQLTHHGLNPLIMIVFRIARLCHESDFCRWFVLCDAPITYPRMHPKWTSVNHMVCLLWEYRCMRVLLQLMQICVLWFGHCLIGSLLSCACVICQQWMVIFVFQNL
jgi:hypothetical protein